jgi:hypothetical protein
MSDAEDLPVLWLCLTGWESGNDIWVRADQVVTVITGVPNAAAVNPAAKFHFPGHPVPGETLTMAGRPYTLVRTPTATYKVSETADSVLDKLAKLFELGDA